MPLNVVLQFDGQHTATHSARHPITLPRRHQLARTPPAARYAAGLTCSKGLSHHIAPLGQRAVHAAAVSGDDEDWYGDLEGILPAEQPREANSQPTGVQPAQAKDSPVAQPESAAPEQGREPSTVSTQTRHADAADQGPISGHQPAAPDAATTADEEEYDSEDDTADFDDEDDQSEMELEEQPSIRGYADDVLTDEMLSQDPPGHKAGYVAIIGKPNAGKSTLLNALLGQKLSIVTAKAQTTRHRVLGILSDKDHQIILLDTPGVMKERRNKLDEKMMRHVQRAMRDADALLVIVDATEPPGEILDMIQPGPGWSGPPVGLALNKTDLLPEDRLQNLVQWFQTNSNVDSVIPISALNATNIQEIRDWAVSRMPEGPTLYPKDMVSEQPERFFVSEIIREKIFEQFREEVPYSSTVQVVKYEERDATAKDYVEVQIIVEHASQRGILLGRGGAAMKKLATAARIDIEEFVGKAIYLDISVKVAEKWRSNIDLVKEYGY